MASLRRRRLRLVRLMEPPVRWRGGRVPTTAFPNDSLRARLAEEGSEADGLMASMLRPTSEGLFIGRRAVAWISENSSDARRLFLILELRSSFSRLGIARTAFGSALGLTKTFLNITIAPAFFPKEIRSPLPGRDARHDGAKRPPPVCDLQRPKIRKVERRSKHLCLIMPRQSI